MKRIIWNWLNSFNLNKKTREKNNKYINRFKKCAFIEGKRCIYYQQYEAVITRYYHTIEKGLTYLEYRPGFGKENINALIQYMIWYIEDGYDNNAFFYKTALSTLHEYMKKNKEYGWSNPDLEERISRLSGSSNEYGGAFVFEPLSCEDVQLLNYRDFIINRHSMRHFSDVAVTMDDVKKAIELAQHAPSACNRQGWRTIVISSEAALKVFLENHSGCRGFGREFDKVLVVTADLRYFNYSRELFQAYVDGGMYAQSLLNSLHYFHIACVPLSASLSTEQENNIRKKLEIDESEIPIIYIGIGNYPDICKTTKSTRKPASIVCK